MPHATPPTNVAGSATSNAAVLTVIVTPSDAIITITVDSEAAAG